jgi:hypothetical protein
MKILVALITPNKRARSTFLTNHATLLRDRDVHETLEQPVQFSATLVDAQLPEDQAHAKLLAESQGFDAVAVILDAASAPKLSAVTSGFFVLRISLQGYIENVQNTLLPITSKLVRNFSFLLAKFENSEQFYAAAVPLRNFDADEARALRDLFSNITLIGNFSNVVSSNIAKLIERRSPKKDSRYPHQYLVDDRGIHFKFGHETHSSIETGYPHLTSCELNGRFRFGKRLPEKRHFNVSIADGRISGSYPNCHDDLNTVKDQKHFNMFSSDFQT